MSKKIEKKAIKTFKARTEKYILACINNLLAESRLLTTLFGRNPAKQIPISATDQSTNTNCTRVKHLSLPEVTIVSKYIAIGSARFGDKLIAESNQAIYSIDKRGQGDWESSFGSWKSGNGLSVDFGRKASEKEIGMNLSRNIIIPLPQINKPKMSNRDIFDLVSRGSPWHVTMKSKSENLVENLRGRNISKNYEREKNSKVKNLGAKMM